MPGRCLIRPGSYFDSVVLMRVASELGARPGVRTASLAMATAANKDVLAAAGLLRGGAAGRGRRGAPAAGPKALVDGGGGGGGGAGRVLRRRRGGARLARGPARR